MTQKEMLRIARKHLTTDSSARFAMEQAVALYDNGEYDKVGRWCLKSLAYSVGVFHPDYKRMAERMKA